MNKKEFSVYLHKPYLIDKHAEIALQEVVTDFPYFQAAHQLLLKAHQNNGSYHFEKQLPLASLLHGNRALLYEYLKDSLLREFRQVAMAEPEITEVTLDEVVNPPASETFNIPELFSQHSIPASEFIAAVENFRDPLNEVEDIVPAAEFIAAVENLGNSKNEIEEIVQTKNEQEEKSITVPDYVIHEEIFKPLPELTSAPFLEKPSIIFETPINAEETELSRIQEEQKPIELFNKSEDNDLPFQNFKEKYLDKRLADPIIVFEINQEEKPELKESPLPTPETSQTPPVIERNEDLPFQNFEEKYLEKSKPENKQNYIEEPQTLKLEPIPVSEEKVVSEIEPQDFLRWLQTKKKGSSPIDSTHSPSVPTNETETTQPDKSSNSELSTGEQINFVPSEKRIRKFNDLIDKFIEKNPSISKPQPTKFFNPVVQAKESMNENFDLVTETLAKIYIKQNNFKKAILVYEKLSLLYPEKISYFAARISELQTLLNK